ncbi:MAG: hypothetical protein KDK70_13830 [Myxococcales bacterium]|nr:hypothetical protein [Myxococcales bacterium]
MSTALFLSASPEISSEVGVDPPAPAEREECHERATLRSPARIRAKQRKEQRTQGDQVQGEAGAEPKTYENKQRYWRCVKRLGWEEETKRIEQERGFRGVMAKARAARCHTAICWGPSHRFALEPLAELPIGKSFSPARSSLGSYINNSGIGLRFNAGLRMWFEWDWWSLALYFATPDLAARETIEIRGSSFSYPVSQIRRPFPGLAIGLLSDNLWIGFDYDVLRNGGADTTRDPSFPPNEVVSRAFSITVAIAPLAGLRNGIGTMVENNRRERESKARSTAPETTDASQTARNDEVAPELGGTRASGERNLGSTTDGAGDRASPDVDDSTDPTDEPTDDDQTGGGGSTHGSPLGALHLGVAQTRWDLLP